MPGGTSQSVPKSYGTGGCQTRDMSDTIKTNSSNTQPSPRVRCVICGKEIRRDPAYELMKVEQQKTKGNLFSTSNTISLNGVEYRFDSQFCNSLFRKLQLLYGNEFCSYLSQVFYRHAELPTFAVKPQVTLRFITGGSSLRTVNGTQTTGSRGYLMKKDRLHTRLGTQPTGSDLYSQSFFSSMALLRPFSAASFAPSLNFEGKD